MDKHGRLVLPKKWRKNYLRKEFVTVKIKGGIIEVCSYETSDLTRYFDSVEVDLKSDLSNWKAVRSELYEVRGC